MDFLYIAWAVLALVFVGIFLKARANEDEAAKQDESAIDPMFRRSKKGRPTVHVSKPTP